ncbi:GNAT family N-acetyltransferase [Dyadobacter aurulentus]|uniref:GNAT family N-acetyltransferase n=1 Tax=Dyadobacter sp. UC 10 TaxID=2605428 RepID=UPI001788B22A|nr:GNAT family N-acetyltransferase [Dyadobacter sp. UC 10]
MIRPATPEDAGAVAPLLILAMGHIAGIFARSNNHADAIPFFHHFFETGNNQYGYDNTLVFEDETGIVGSVTGYDGALLHQLRKPVLDLIRETQPDFNPSDETEAGEYYIDCVNVRPDHQGRGIGKKLIQAFCEKAASSGYARVGLIVDQVNPEAKRLYEKLGFKIVGERDFMGHQYHHMVFETLTMSDNK